MAALYSVGGFISLSFNANASLDSEKRAVYQRAQELVQQFSTGTGTGGSAVDMVYFDEIALTASLSATALDLQALAQAGNTMVMVRPKHVLLLPLSGTGTAFFDRGATNGYTGWPADGISVSAALGRMALIPCYVSTGASDKTIDYSETAGAAITVLVVVLGSSA